MIALESTVVPAGDEALVPSGLTGRKGIHRLKDLLWNGMGFL